MSPLVPRPASTVLFLRDEGSALEVLMLRKTTRVDFASGAYVFPGGAVDPADVELAAYCVGGQSAPDLFGKGEESIGYFVAAIREAFEESGVLLAKRHPDGPVDRVEAEGWRRAINGGEATFNEIVMGEKLTLEAGALTYFSHWITPVGPPRRYDTRFFFARMPEGQVARHEGSEVVDTRWTRPRDALESAARKEIEVIFPTLKTLELMSRFSSVGEVESWASRLEVGVVEPRVVTRDGGIEILVPGDEGYDEAAAR